MFYFILFYLFLISIDIFAYLGIIEGANFNPLHFNTDYGSAYCHLHLAFFAYVRDPRRGKRGRAKDWAVLVFAHDTTSFLTLAQTTNPGAIDPRCPRWFTGAAMLPNGSYLRLLLPSLWEIEVAAAAAFLVIALYYLVERLFFGGRTRGENDRNPLLLAGKESPMQFDVKDKVRRIKPVFIVRGDLGTFQFMIRGKL